MLSKDKSIHVTDERFNIISHVVAGIFSILGGSYLIVRTGMNGNAWDIVGASIYGFSLVFLFVASTLHHGINAKPQAEEVFRTLDYAAVFLLIAGTITPIILTLLRNAVGWASFGTVWLCAGAGIALRSSWRKMPKWLTNTIYVAIGWIGIVVAISLYPLIQFTGFMLFALSGIVYTTGSVIYYVEKPNPIPGKFGFHEIWHLFVVVGAVLHYFFVSLYVLP